MKLLLHGRELTIGEICSFVYMKDYANATFVIVGQVGANNRV
jgi:hypothetical protein